MWHFFEVTAPKGSMCQEIDCAGVRLLAGYIQLPGHHIKVSIRTPWHTTSTETIPQLEVLRVELRTGYVRLRTRCGVVFT